VKNKDEMNSARGKHFSEDKLGKYYRKEREERTLGNTVTKKTIQGGELKTLMGSCQKRNRRDFRGKKKRGKPEEQE